MGKAFSTEFEPVAYPGENILLLPTKEAYRVEFVEQIPVIEKDFGALDADAETDSTKLTELELDDMQLGQYRMYFVDNVAITEFRQPFGAGRFVIKNTVGQIDQTFQNIDFTRLSQFTEFYVFEDDVPHVKVKNISGAALSNSRIKFFGWKYYLTKLPRIPETYKTVPVAGYSMV